MGKMIMNVRKDLNAKRATRDTLVAEIKAVAVGVSEDQINEVLDALWLIGKSDK